MIRAQKIVGSEAFDILSAEWDTLASQGITDTPFQKLAYQQSWFNHLGEGDLLTLAVYEDELLIGIGCFNLRGETITFNASKEETDYLDIITTEEKAEVVWRAIFDQLFAADVPAWSSLDFYNIPANSPSRPIIAALCNERAISCGSERAEVCPVINLPATFDEYLANIDKKQRHEIKRKMRRATGADAVLHIVDENDDLSAEVDSFLTLLQQSTPEKRDWLTPGRRAHFHSIAQAAMADQTLQLMFIEIEGEKAAGLFNYVYDDRCWVYNSGLNPDHFGKLSLGVTLTSKAIEKSIELGLATFDFLRGDEEYKYRFGAEDSEIFRLTVTR